MSCCAKTQGNLSSYEMKNQNHEQNLKFRENASTSELIFASVSLSICLGTWLLKNVNAILHALQTLGLCAKLKASLAITKQVFNFWRGWAPEPNIRSSALHFSKSKIRHICLAIRLTLFSLTCEEIKHFHLL